MDTREKVVTAESFADVVLDAESQKRKVFTNGCFDILHSGHVTTLERARSLGHVLFVGINTDHSVRRLKGPQRPVNDICERARVLAALACVDYVVPFDSDTPEDLIHIIRPNILVKGSDWKGREVAGAKFVIDTGGTVVFVPTVPNVSTTKILEMCQR